MCPEGISLSSTYCQPSASSSRPSGAPRDCTLPNVGNATLQTSAILQTTSTTESQLLGGVSLVILLQATCTLSRQPSRWSHTPTAPHVSCWMVLLQRAASPPSALGALVQTLRCAPFMPTRRSINSRYWSCNDIVELQTRWLCSTLMVQRPKLDVSRDAFPANVMLRALLCPTGGRKSQPHVCGTAGHRRRDAQHCIAASAPPAVCKWCAWRR
jgi:hypothetical protein